MPVTLLEYLTFLESMKKNVANFDIDRFYYLARCCLVKDERNIDKFDKVFGSIFEGVEFIGQILEADIPEDWLKKLTEKILSPTGNGAIRSTWWLGRVDEDFKREAC